MMSAIWSAAVEQFEQGRDFVLATILGVRGSSPRHVGTRFLVRTDGRSVGTIGGGLFEAQVLRIAQTALEARSSRRAMFSFTGEDAQAAQMICGGEAEVLVEFVDSGDKAQEQIVRRLNQIAASRTSAYLFTRVPSPREDSAVTAIDHLLVEPSGGRTGGFPGDEEALRLTPNPRLLKPAQFLAPPDSEHAVFLEWLHPHGTVYLFGAGHVGVCVAHLAAYVDFRVVVVDDRSEFASRERVPDADDVMVLDSFADAFGSLAVDEDSYVVIVTRGHIHDKTVLCQALRTRAGYVGMIGSRRKNRIIFESLLMEGFSREDLERVHAPIGLPIGGETPQEIAVSIVAEMIQVRNRRDQLKHLGAQTLEASPEKPCAST